jgi:hypothetical protein
MKGMEMNIASGCLIFGAVIVNAPLATHDRESSRPRGYGKMNRCMPGREAAWWATRHAPLMIKEVVVLRKADGLPSRPQR